MYTEYFGLDKAPFKITPDPEFFFPGANRGAVLDALLYAVSRGEGIVKVVGEVGSGKTMLCRMLERELPDDCEIIYLANPRLNADEILRAIALELSIDIGQDASKLELTRTLHDYLLEKHANGRRVVMFIEEAQGMAVDTLEEVRLLSNLETTQEKLLQIVLFGQPELDTKLQLHEIRQLRERITYAFDLAPLNRVEIRDYVNTRIRASGFRGNDLFSADGVRELERRSGGLLRRINILADKALLAAYAGGDRLVKGKHVRLAARDSEFGGPRSYSPAMMFAGAVVLGLVAALAVWWAVGMTASAGLYGSDARTSSQPPAPDFPTAVDAEIARPPGPDGDRPDAAEQKPASPFDSTTVSDGMPDRNTALIVTAKPPREGLD